MADRKDNTTGGSQGEWGVGRAGSQAASSGATSANKPGGAGQDRGRDIRGVSDVAGAAAEQARDYAGQAVEQARGMAGQLANDVREVAESLLDEQKERALGHVTGVADALRKTAEGLGEHNEMAGRYAEQAAHQVERFAESMRDRSLGDLVADIDDFARRQPTMFLVGAVAIGFVVGRFMAASADRNRADWEGDRARVGGPRRSRAAGYGAAGAGNGHAASYQRGNA
jgi:hypothetical protein